MKKTPYHNYFIFLNTHKKVQHRGYKL